MFQLGFCGRRDDKLLREDRLVYYSRHSRLFAIFLYESSRRIWFVQKFTFDTHKINFDHLIGYVQRHFELLSESRVRLVLESSYIKHFRLANSNGIRTA